MVEAILPIWKDTCERCGRGFDSGEPVLCRFVYPVTPHVTPREFFKLVRERFNPGFPGGADWIRTSEWRFCKPLPYHLATAPDGCSM